MPDTVAIVGSAADKFTPRSTLDAKGIIFNIIDKYDKNEVTIISGESPLGGVDIWTHEIATRFGYNFHAFIPRINSWNPSGYGFKARNLDIAKSDIVNVVVPNIYPISYKKQRFNYCYHCGVNTHIKSGGCWTAKEAIKIGNQAYWYIIEQKEE